MTFLNFTFQDPSPLISYSDGQWVEGSPTNDSLAASYSEGSFKVTFDTGSTATLAFVGTSITIYGAKRPNHGNYSVVLDNGPEFVGDGNGNNIFQFPLWNAQNLSNSQHSVTVTNEPTGQGKFLDLDFISIGRELGPPGFDGPISNLTLDDQSPFIVYNGTGWDSQFSSTALNSSLHLTTEEGSSLSIFFQGSSIELYGLYVNAPFQINLDNQLPRQLAGPNVDLNAQQAHPQTLLFMEDGLDENKTHVITMTNRVTNSGRPLYFDYAIIRSSQSFFNGTPSSHPGFTIPSPATTSAASPITQSMSQSRPVPVGAIVGGVVGGVGGLLVLAFIGFILLRRSRYYHSSPPKSTRTDGEAPPDPVTQQRRGGGITPFILPSVAPGSNSGNQSTVDPHRKGASLSVSSAPSGPASLQSYSPPSSHTSDNRLSQTTSEDHTNPPTLSTTQGAPQQFVIGGSGSQPQGNTLITQAYILQEHDAGRLIQTRLPPMYNDDWQGTTS